MENPAAAPFFTKNGNKTGGLSTTWLKEGVPPGGSKEKGTEIAFRPHFSPVFLLPSSFFLLPSFYARRQKKCRSAVSRDRPTPFPFCPA
ncbi:hypothetical protein [Ralstonia flatus]|uniref:hypothetical protein n=1 Tax=Ralstonia flatus TaxID=3058601 RepID=UPI0019808D4C|nr:hypothetical protein [Ralstonia sp. LMG 32965]MBN6208911.1 hypothetical protein [Ralstonia pickettii]